MKRINSILWGAALVAASAVLALNAFGITDIEIFFDGWWTLFIIVPSIIGLFGGRDKTINIIGLLIGIFLLLSCQNILSFNILWRLALPVIIAIIGIKMIIKGISGNKYTEITEKLKENSDKIKVSCATFSGQDIHFDNEVFNGAELTAVFGGIECDLRNAVFNSDVVITTCCVFGGIDILLPENVNLKVNSNSIFGGVDSKKNTRTHMITDILFT